MSEEGGHHNPVHYYGAWPARVGLLLGGGLMWLLFALADPFS